MRSVAHLPFHAVQVLILRGASLLVPFHHRAEWYEEWTCELWHVRHCCNSEPAFSWTTERELIAFCLGSYRDAACLLRQDWRTALPASQIHGSGMQCILCLSTLLALCAIVAHLLPGIDSEREAFRDQPRPGVMVIQQDGYGGAPSIAFSEYRVWNAHRQRYFATLAYYRPEDLPASPGSSSKRITHIAFASENLFQLLTGDAFGSAPRGVDTGMPQAVLSRAYWRRAFHSNPGVIGQTLWAEDRAVRVAAIAPGAAERLPGAPDLWVLDTDTQLAHLSQGGRGYVLGQLTAEGEDQVINGGSSITAYDLAGNEIVLEGLTFGPQTSGIGAVYLFALFLAILALPAITTVFSTESNFASLPIRFSARVRRSAFFASKILLIVAIAYFAGLDLGYWGFPDYSPTAELLQFAATFGISLFGLRWALKDQSRRCPVCLRRVTHPAQVGIASCNFLGWNGTEMVCMGGHALLHVPGLPTSWFSRERWLFLDTSWDFLFAETMGPN
jgi:hypothetical protein